MQKIVEYPEIGTVIFSKRKRNRNIRISIRSDRSVLVTFPSYVSYRKAGKFLKKNIEWVKSSQQKSSEREAAKRGNKRFLIPQFFNNGTHISMLGGDIFIKRSETSILKRNQLEKLRSENLLFPLEQLIAQPSISKDESDRSERLTNNLLGESDKATYKSDKVTDESDGSERLTNNLSGESDKETHESGKATYNRDGSAEEWGDIKRQHLFIDNNSTDNSTTIFYPSNWPDKIDPKSNMHAVIERVCVGIIRERAKIVLKEKADLFANMYHLKYNQLRVKNLRRIWGSCSNRNNLNFNIKVVLLPEHLCDMIVKHELSHIPHKNHGSEFYKLLDTMCEGNLKEYRKELRGYSL